MLTRFFSWFLNNLIFKEKDFEIAPDEGVLLRGVASLETKFFLTDGVLILTSKRLAHRSLATGIRPSWFGGKRAAVDIPINDIMGLTADKKRISPLDPTRSTVLIVRVRDCDEPYTFVTVNPETWQQRIDGLRAAHDQNKPP